MAATFLRQLGRRPLGAVLAVSGLVVIGLGAAEEVKKAGPELAPLPLKLPMPGFSSGPDDRLTGPHVEPVSDKLRPPFLAPVGVKNVALHKKVMCSDPKPRDGEPSLVTDGNKEPSAEVILELHSGVQWVQIDLEKPFDIYAILIWHDHRDPRTVFRSVVVQAADTPDFAQNVLTLFNNDYENRAGCGPGQDKRYFESNQGKLIDSKGIKTRYLRFYSAGSDRSSLNCYEEIEVWGLPAP